MSGNYVDNKKFLKVLVDYKKDVKSAEKSGSPKPPIPEYIGECLLLIANRLATRPNFINYTYKDEFVGDAMENCFTYLLNFNPKKSKNPFAYFTQIIYFAFLRRIRREKMQLYIKHKTLVNCYFDDTLTTKLRHDNQDIGSEFLNTDNPKLDALIELFETKKEKIPKKIVKGILDEE